MSGLTLHLAGDCNGDHTCSFCAAEDDAKRWTCEAHGITTTGDCWRCEDELIALTEEQASESGEQA